LLKFFQGHALVQLLEYLRVGGLQPDGNLKIATQHVTELETPLVDELRMALNYNSLEWGEQLGYFLIIFRGYGFGIEKIPGIVQFDVAGSWQVGYSMLYLMGNSSWQRLFSCRVFPQIAHKATKGALPVRQKNCCYFVNRAGRGTLLLDKESVRLPCIHRIFRRPVG
jgi:hypothetical protein